MTNEKLLNFTELYFNSLDENMELTIQELEEAGIDVSASEKRTQELLNRVKAELEIEKGKAIQIEFEETLRENIGESLEDTENDYRLAAKNFENLTEEDKKIIEQNKAVLKNLENKQKNK